MKKIILSSLILLTSLSAEETEEVAAAPEEHIEEPEASKEDKSSAWKMAGVVLGSIAMVTIGLVAASSNGGGQAESRQ